MNSAQSVLETFLHVQEGGRIVALPAGSFWEELARGAFPQLERGRLLSASTFSESWSTWERHPAGEELVMLLVGAASVILDEGGVQRVVTLATPGAFVLVPPGVWHTATPAMPTTLLFLTPGAGTEHRPA